MRDIIIYHESPLDIFDDVQKATGGDYFLVHLFETNPAYKEKAKEAVAKGREVILDNSIFELGEAFDMAKFAAEVIDLRPTWYIVPDVLENGPLTGHNFLTWIFQYKSLVDRYTNGESHMMATVQGRDFDEIATCYKLFDKMGVQRIGIPFDLSYYCKTHPDPNHLISWSKGRPALLKALEENGVLNRNKEHHLLGCACAGEGYTYSQDKRDWYYITSVDTSSPVVRGLQGQGYPDKTWGNVDKPDTKLYTLMDDKVSPAARKVVLDNIKTFSSIWNSVL